MVNQPTHPGEPQSCGDEKQALAAVESDPEENQVKEGEGEEG